AVVLPPGFATPAHHHERQQELYIVLEGEIEITLGGESRTLGPGGLARVDAGTVRNLRNLSTEREATYVCVGGDDGYVGGGGGSAPRASRSRISVSSRMSSAGAFGSGSSSFLRRAASAFSGLTTKKKITAAM